MAAGAVAIVLLVGAVLGAPSPAGGGQQEAKKYSGRAVADVLRELQATTPEDHLQLRASAAESAGPPGAARRRIPATSRCRSSSRTVSRSKTAPEARSSSSPSRGGSRSPRRRGVLKAEVPGDRRSLRIAEHVDVTDRTERHGPQSRVFTPSIRPKHARWRAASTMFCIACRYCLASPRPTTRTASSRSAAPARSTTLIVFDGVQIHNAAAHGRVHDQLHESGDGGQSSRSIRPGSTRVSAAGCRRSSTSRRATARPSARWPRPDRSG